jgi:Protein of unknown function (DUF742)
VNDPQGPHRDGAEPREPYERLVRPYVVTRGRTHAAGQALPMETVVVAVGSLARLPPSAPSEAASILTLCRDPMSIAELAARARVPVGVARVLVGDLAALGLVDLGTTADGDEQDNIALLERLLDGIRAL